MVEINEKQVFSILMKAKDTGSLKIGINEVTKAIERGIAKLVVVANDVSPAEIIAHIPKISSEMKVVSVVCGKKEELGSCVKIKATSAIAVIEVGEAKKELGEFIEEFNSQLKPKVEEKKEKKEDKPKVEEKVEKKEDKPKVEEKVEKKEDKPKVEEKVEKKIDKPKVEEKKEKKENKPKVEEKVEKKVDKPKVEEKEEVLEETQQEVLEEKKTS